LQIGSSTAIKGEVTLARGGSLCCRPLIGADSLPERRSGMDKIEKNKNRLGKAALVLSVIRSVASLLYLLYRITSE